jgi:DNA-binding SARP family transcriptional activator
MTPGAAFSGRCGSSSGPRTPHSDSVAAVLLGVEHEGAVSAPPLAFRLLGPFDVRHCGALLDAGTPRQRALLAVMLLADGPVCTDQIIDQLWGDRVPRTAIATVRVYVSRLRRMFAAIGLTDVIGTTASGYELASDGTQVDSVAFEGLVAAGMAAHEDGDPERSELVLRHALAMWHGPALADFRYEEFAQAEISRLEEMRALASERAVAAALERGNAWESVAELRALVRRYPLREAMWEQLVVALVRSGLTGEARRAYEHAHRTFERELGVQPSLPCAEASIDESMTTTAVRFDVARPAKPVSEPNGTCEAHAVYYLGAVAAITPMLGGEHQAGSLTTLGSQLNNVAAAWRWAAANQRAELLDAGLDGLFLFYEMRSRFGEGAELLGDAMRTAGDHARMSPVARRTTCRIAARHAFFSLRIGRYDDAFEELMACLGQLDGFSERRDEHAFCMLAAGIASLKLGAFDRAATLLSTSLALHESLEMSTGVWDCLENLAEVALRRGDLDEAIRRYERGLAVSREACDRRGMAFCHLGLAAADQRRDRGASAFERCGTARDLFDELGDSEGVARSLVGSAVASAGSGPAGESRQLLADALEIARPIGSRPLLHLVALAGVDLLGAENPTGGTELAACLLADERLAPVHCGKLKAALLRFAHRLASSSYDAAVARGAAAALDELALEAINAGSASG